MSERGGNELSLGELGGAFGDLGTLVPYLLGYVTVAGLEPAGILITLGAMQIATGLRFRTPVAVQPMKAIGTAAISHAGAVTGGALAVAGVFSGLLWLVLALSGAIEWIARVTPRAVVYGLVLGLGMALAVQGLRLMAADPIVAAVAAVATIVLLRQPAFPTMLALLAAGVVVALVREPALLSALGAHGATLRLPPFSLANAGAADVLAGVVVLALPQAALTLGNAVLATVEENNRLFPGRRTSVRAVAASHGVMNLVAGPFGGIPLCHGAGGMAGHVRFGARTGGAMILLGVLVLATGLFFAGATGALLRMVPGAILGIILAAAGVELVMGAVVAWPGAPRAGIVLAVTAALALWNMAVAFAAGFVLAWALGARRGGEDVKRGSRGTPDAPIPSEL